MQPAAHRRGWAIGGNGVHLFAIGSYLRIKDSAFHRSPSIKLPKTELCIAVNRSITQTSTDGPSSCGFLLHAKFDGLKRCT